jgi:hypothetical protein
MLQHLSKSEIPTTVCTMYKPNFGPTDQQRMCETALSVLNHVIITEAMKVKNCLKRRPRRMCSYFLQVGFPVIDLTTIFNQLTDYANHIEPDVPGGAKIVENILFVMDQHRFEQNISSLYAKPVQSEEVS